MKIRTDFVTNSSSSSFVFQITINLKESKELKFNSRSAKDKTGHAEYFAYDAYVTVSPKELGLSKDVEELIGALTKGVCDTWDSEDDEYYKGKEPRYIFSEDCPPECGDETLSDASYFIKDIRSNVKSMDDIRSISIRAETEPFHYGDGKFIRQYTYDLETGEYIGQEFGEDFYNCQGCEGYLNIDINDCKIQRVRRYHNVGMDPKLLELEFIIEDGVLKEYNGSGGDVTIPDSVQVIGKYAFKDCADVTSVTIPDSVTCIEQYAFRGCTGITGIIIPDSVTKIGESAFAYCEELTSIVFGNGVTAISKYVFSGCAALTDIVIPDGITEISNSAFSECTSLTNIKIPNSVKEIGSWAFSGCTKLKNINLHNKITAIRDHAFFNSGITAVTIPGSVTVIENDTFCGCNNLTEVMIEVGVKEIGAGAFSYCTALADIKLPDSLEKIEAYAFVNCAKLTNIILPGKIAKIQSGAFYNCSGITRVTIPGSLATVGHIFEKCENLTEIIIEDGVREIGSNAFLDCARLKTVSIPDSVTAINGWAFYGCKNISLSIPDSVTKIERDIFNKREKITVTYKGKTYTQDNIDEFYALFK